MENISVIKRDGTKEPISFDKVLERIKGLCNYEPKLLNVDYAFISKKTIEGIYPGVTTRELDELAASIAQPLIFDHPDYGVLASRLLVSNHHKNTLFYLSSICGKLKNIIEKNIFEFTAKALYENTDENNEQYPLIAPDIYKIIKENTDKLEKIINYNNDYNYDFMGYKILEETYLQKCSININDKKKRVVIERPQHSIMRVVLGIHCSSKYKNFNKLRQNDKNIYSGVYDILGKYISKKYLDKIMKQSKKNKVIWREVMQMIKDKTISTSEINIDIIKVENIIKYNTISWNDLLNKFTGKINDTQWNDIIETYNLMSGKYFTHATPTLFNSGTLKPQLSSCFLVQLPFDSMDGITDFWKTCAELSKWAGGIGSHVHNIRAKGSYIRGTNGQSNGLTYMLKVVNDESVYVDQCFGADTIVYTKSGIKKIAEILTTDKLITSDGTFQKVKQVRQYSISTTLKKINCKQSTEPIVVTDKHPLLAIEDVDDISIIKNKLNLGIFKHKYIEAKDLDEDYMLAFPIPKYEKDMNYSLEDCYMYGVMSELGSFSRDMRTFEIFTSIKKQYEYVEDYLRVRNIKYETKKINGSTLITASKNEHFPFTRSMLYNEKSEKIICEPMLHLPKDKSLMIIRGLVDSNVSQNDYNTKKIKIKSCWNNIFSGSFKNVVEALKYILLRLKIGSWGHFINEDGIKKYILTFPNPFLENEILVNKHYLIHNEYLYSRIKSIRSEKYNGILTDFEMDKNHNYLTQIGLAHNGGNKRPGSHAVYLETWHADIFDVLSLKKSRGNDADRARNLFYAMWISDEFMRTIQYEFKLESKYKNDDNVNEIVKSWYLMCPDISENLSNLYDEKFTTEWISDEVLFDSEKVEEMQKNYAFTYRYRSYIKQNKYIKKVSAIELWKHICEIIEETGVPYMTMKDACNRKSNQKNLGTIKSSNLCTEIVEYSSVEEVAVCNLSSTVLTSVVTEFGPVKSKYRDMEIIDYFETSLNHLLGKDYISELKYFDWNMFEKIIRRQVRNINKIIDINFYPVKQAKYSNKLHRPIAMGTQDFAHLLSIFRLAFDSKKALELNFYIYEFMYYIALDESCNEAIKHREYKLEKYKNSKDPKYVEKYNYYLNNKTSGAYKTFIGSPASRGELQFDLWIKEQNHIGRDALMFPLSLKWDEFKTKYMEYGFRNSLLLALMPTGSTSTIMGCTPCFEPYNGLVMKRRNKTGEHSNIDKYLIYDLIKLNLWNKNILNELMMNPKGSIADITKIPKELRDIYKTVWDISPKITSDMCLGRGVFIDQSQSYTVFMPKPTIKNLTQFHFYNWKNGIKTSSYYTRRLAVTDAQKIQVETSGKKSENDEICTWQSGCKTCES